MRILGIDPGYARLGWGIVEEHRPDRPEAVGYGCIETPKTWAPAKRLWTIAERIRAILTEYHPEGVMMERLFFGRNVTTAVQVGEARGVILSCCGEAALEVQELTPAAIKQAITGSGRAEKGQVQLMVTRLLRLSEVPQPDDTADALAIAWAGWTHAQADRVLRRARS